MFNGGEVPVRVYEFARNYEMTSKELVGICQELGISVKAQSKLDEKQLSALSQHFNREEGHAKPMENVSEVEACLVEMDTNDEVEACLVEMDTNDEVEACLIEMDTNDEVEECLLETDANDEVEECLLETDANDEVEECLLETDANDGMEEVVIADQPEEGIIGRKMAYIVTECEPFTSLGELGKISAEFAKKRVSEGHSLVVALPKYQSITDAYGKEMDWLMDLPVRLGNKTVRVSLFKLVIDSVTYLFIGNDGYFHRDDIYGYDDDVERFAFFNRAVLEALPYLGDAVEEIHLNDWHTSMIPLMLEVDYKSRPFYQGVKTILTIHNLEYQGWCEAEILPSILGISRQYYENGLTRMGDAVNLLKSGIETAHQIRLQGMSQSQLTLPQIQQSGMVALIENKLNHQVA